eukprot:309796-Pleurochrysis_carterae.AAC.1
MCRRCVGDVSEVAHRRVCAHLAEAAHHVELVLGAVVVVVGLVVGGVGVVLGGEGEAVRHLRRRVRGVQGEGWGKQQHALGAACWAGRARGVRQGARASPASDLGKPRGRSSPLPRLAPLRSKSLPPAPKWLCDTKCSGDGVSEQRSFGLRSGDSESTLQRFYTVSANFASNFQRGLTVTVVCAIDCAIQSGHKSTAAWQKYLHICQDIRGHIFQHIWGHRVIRGALQTDA